MAGAADCQVSTKRPDSYSYLVIAPEVATAQRLSRETATRQPKAAFTLRLDHDRHLRLRLASALLNSSAQHLVTEALDRFLENVPEVDALMRQVPIRAKN